MSNTESLVSLFNIMSMLIKDSMNSGELAAISNNAVIMLRYRDDSDKELAPVIAVIAPSNGNNDVMRWSLIGLAILAVLLALLATRKLMQKKKRNEKDNYILDELSNPPYTYDFSVVPDPHRSIGTNLPIEKQLAIPKIKPSGNEHQLAPLDLESLDDFIVGRFKPHDELVLSEKRMSSLNNGVNADYDNRFKDACGSLNHVYLGSVKNRSLSFDDEKDYTFEAMGTNRGITPKCSICFKNADGWMKRCQCGNSSCTKIAHATCIYGRNPTPSISYPGTPPPALPAILCASENRALRRSRSYDEESSIVSGVSRSLSFDDSVYAHDKLSGGMMGCLDCR